jgi:Flp pilus assembly protein TadG
MSRFYISAQKILRANGSGQAAVELALAVTVLLILMCATIDFGRALNDLQILSELSRQGANLASRGSGTTSCDNLCTAANSVVSASSGLNLTTTGKVIITQLTQTTPTAGGPYTIAEQASAGSLSSTSKLGSSGSVSITGAPALQKGQTLYAAEIFYTFTPATGIGAMTNSAISLPTTMYDVAYF